MKYEINVGMHKLMLRLLYSAVYDVDDHRLRASSLKKNCIGKSVNSTFLKVHYLVCNYANIVVDISTGKL